MTTLQASKPPPRPGADGDNQIGDVGNPARSRGQTVAINAHDSGIKKHRVADEIGQRIGRTIIVSSGVQYGEEFSDVHTTTRRRSKSFRPDRE